MACSSIWRDAAQHGSSLCSSAGTNAPVHLSDTSVSVKTRTLKSHSRAALYTEPRIAEGNHHLRLSSLAPLASAAPAWESTAVTAVCRASV